MDSTDLARRISLATGFRRASRHEDGFTVYPVVDGARVGWQDEDRTVALTHLTIIAHRLGEDFTVTFDRRSPASLQVREGATR